jgi:serine/threonine-protein kinase RsbW
MGGRLSLRAAAVPESVELVHDLLGELWEGEPGIELMDRIRFETALIEVASNIIEHSRPAGADPVRFVLAVECEPERLYAEFMDNARPAGIDLSRAELPDDLLASGRGLALAKVALDQFSYAKEDGGNRWTLLCRRKSEATASQ